MIPPTRPDFTQPNDFSPSGLLLKNLSLIPTHLSDMKAKVDDSLLLIGNWVYGVSRSIYATMQPPAAGTLMPEQQQVLQQRFARSTKKKTQQATAA